MDAPKSLKITRKMWQGSVKETRSSGSIGYGYMLDKIWDFFVDSCAAIFIPLIFSYYSISQNFFLNFSAADAIGFEKGASTLLIPFQYVFSGELGVPDPEKGWRFEQRFDYSSHFWIKLAGSIIALPPSIVLGGSLKAFCYAFASYRDRFEALQAAYLAPPQSNIDQFRKLGLQIGPSDEAETLESLGYARRVGDERYMAEDKELLKEAGALLTAHGIPWWVDCGTCLGAYRYGGIIPWDEDVDMAVLAPDFDNVRRALLQLDPSKYLVQDWSGRLNPHNYFKVFVRKTGNFLDIYHFAIEPETKTIRYLLSLDSSSMFPEWWKIRERRFLVPAPFDHVFPLKRALFDGVEVFVPNQTEKYLQRCYGENLAPAKIYDPTTDAYEKDLNHPYWQRAYAH